MKATKVTLTAATAGKLATGGVNCSAILSTALTDLYLGESAALTSDGAASFKVGTITVPFAVPAVVGELWGISAAGGAVYVLQNE